MKEREEHLGLRLNSIELTRAVEQAALTLCLHSTYVPHPHRELTPRRLALASVLGHLSRAYCRGKLVHLDEEHYGEAKTKERVLEPMECQRSQADQRWGMAPVQETWNLDLVVTPVDGFRAFRNGYPTGAVSVIAGGPARAFISEKETKDAPLHLVVVTRADPAIAVPTGGSCVPWSPLEDLFQKWELATARGDTLHVAMPTGTMAEAFLDHLIRKLPGSSSDKMFPTAATNFSSETNEYAFRVMRKLLLETARLRTLTLLGSSVAAAFSVMLPRLGVDWYLGIVKTSNLIQIAVGALATGADVVAIPITPEKDGRDYRLTRERPILGVKDIVPAARMAEPDDLFVMCTGITENMVVNGVRVMSRSKMSSHTLCMRSASRSIRVIQHEHDLLLKPFRFHPAMPDTKAFEDILVENKVIRRACGAAPTG